MGVYIKDMEMPKKDGSWVTLRVFPDGKCFLYSWCEIDFDFMEHLTAVPVPPHGRLIDADAFEKQNAYFWNRDFINPKYSETLADLVNDAPTIIPASEEGE